MPYIKKEDRIKFDESLNKITHFETKGELEYCIFKLMVAYKKERISNYTNLHDCAYAAMHCGDEFCRRFLDERENQAITTNGDIDG